MASVTQFPATWTQRENRELISKGILEIGDGYRAKNGEMESDGLPFARAGNVNGGFDFNKADILSAKSVVKAREKISQVDDVVITTKGTFGRLAYVRSNTPTFVYSPQLCYWRVKNRSILDPRFLFYWLQGPEFYAQSFQIKSSTDMADYANLTDQRAMAITAPQIHNQRKIAAVLTAYDDLIETNKRRIDILEEMAEGIYREWFVRMRFPGHQNTKFIKSIPEGWPFDFGSTFFDHVKGKSYSAHEISDHEGSCFFVTLKSFRRRGGYRKGGLKYYSGTYKDEQCVIEGDVVMAVTDMTQDRAIVGEVARIPSLPGKKAVVSLDVIKLIPKGLSETFLYAYMRHSGFANYIKEFANGANVLHLKPDLVGKQRLLFPPENLRDQFSKIVEPFYREVDALASSIAVLTKTRDLLLPRLISGKLSVENLEIQFPPSMAETEPEES